MSETKFIELYKVRDRANLVLYLNGNLIASEVINCSEDDIKDFKEYCRKNKIKYQINR